MTGNQRQRRPLCGMVAVLAAGLAACTPNDAYQRPLFPFLSSYRAAPAGTPVLLTNTQWWQRLNDPTLNRLITLALADSPTLERARERVVQARAERGQVPLATVLNASVGGQLEGSGNDNPNLTGTGRIGPSWLLDPWGGRRAQLRAAGARIEAADAEADAAQLLLLFNLANAYVDLRFQQRLLTLRQQELRGRNQTLAMTRTMLAANSATRLEILRSEARVAEITAELPGLKSAVTARKNEIAVLAGTAPGTLPPDLTAALDRFAPQPRPDLSPDVGIPADLVRNRPDIRIAERSYYAALADVGVARAALYPRLSLTGAITFNALERSGSGTNYYFGPTLQLPALPGDNAYAAVDARQSQARQALSEWKSTVLSALLEVENGLLDYHATAASIRAAGTAARLYREALDLTREVFARQNATLGDLIDAEKALADSDQRLAETLQQYGRDFVALNVRLGSGNAAGSAAPRTTPATARP